MKAATSGGGGLPTGGPSLPDGRKQAPLPEAQQKHYQHKGDAVVARRTIKPETPARQWYTHRSAVK